MFLGFLGFFKDHMGLHCVWLFCSLFWGLQKTLETLYLLVFGQRLRSR